MRIGVDARNLVPPLSGIGRYVWESCKHLSKLGHEVYLYLPEAPSFPFDFKMFKKVNVSNYNGPINRIIWGNLILPELIFADRIDVFWGPAHRLPLLKTYNHASVLTVHDLVWKRVGFTMRTSAWLSEKLFMERSINRANRIVAVSRATKTDIENVFPQAKGKIDIVYPGCNHLKPNLDILDKLDIDRSFFLFVGTLEPRKNLSRVLEAYSMIPPTIRKQLLFVIAGGKGWKLEQIQSKINMLGITSDVKLAGFVSDEQLHDLYTHARFLVMPSLYEGFGFPIIEANAHGVPVLTSRISSMPEVAGKAAYLVDPLDVASIHQGLIKLATDEDLYQRLASQAAANARRFSWTKSACALIEVFEKLG